MVWRSSTTNPKRDICEHLSRSQTWIPIQHLYTLCFCQAAILPNLRLSRFHLLSVYSAVPPWHLCALLWVGEVCFLNPACHYPSSGMLRTAEDPDTLEKVDHGEEMLLCGLAAPAFLLTHTPHSLIVTHSVIISFLPPTPHPPFPFSTFSLCLHSSVTFSSEYILSGCCPPNILALFPSQSDSSRCS